MVFTFVLGFFVVEMFLCVICMDRKDKYKRKNKVFLLFIWKEF